MTYNVNHMRFEPRNTSMNNHHYHYGSGSNSRCTHYGGRRY